MSKKGLLIDVGKCIGCHGCTSACKVKNDTSKGIFWTKVSSYEKGTFPNTNEHTLPSNRCMHCEQPVCVSVCDSEALQKLQWGPVVYDKEKCTGSGACVEACPFQVPELDSEDIITKCNFCADLQKAGLAPACASICPTGALKFGDRNSLLAEAKKRIRASGGRYVNHIYGEYEVGGTSLLYIAPVVLKELGFPEVGTKPLAILRSLREQMAAYGTAVIAGVAAVALGGFSWLAQRKEEIKKSRAG